MVTSPLKPHQKKLHRRTMKNFLSSLIQNLSILSRWCCMLNHNQLMSESFFL